MKQRDDAELMVAIAGGDRMALAVVYDRHAPSMLGVARRMLGDAQQAEDLLHDVFLEAWKKAGSYRPEKSKVSTWLMMRLRSRALDQIRASSRSPTVALDGNRDVPSEPVDADDPSLGLDRVVMRRALAQLPDEQRTVLELGYFYGLSCSEIASRADIPLGTAKSRIAAGLSKLRASLATGEPA